MTGAEKLSFLNGQSTFRTKLIGQLEKVHGQRSVRMALGHLDHLVEVYSDDSSSVAAFNAIAKICEHIRGKRGASRSWNIAGQIFTELLRNLGAQLEAIEREKLSRQRKQPAANLFA